MLQSETVEVDDLCAVGWLAEEAFEYGVAAGEVNEAQA